MAFEEPYLSIVTPIYQCEPCLVELYKRLKNSLTPITTHFEIIMVDDNSKDNSWNVIERLASLDTRVIGIHLSRNFGQHHAITAGLDFAKGDWVVVMDGDLQDQPEEIPKLYHKAQEGYDVVFGRRYERRDSSFKKWGSHLFYKIYDYLTDHQTDKSIANFSICSKTVIENFRNLREQNRSFPLFVNWMGFRSSSVNIEHAERFAGKSSYNLRRLLNLAVDGIVSQSNKPLKLAVKLGFFISFAFFLYGLYLVFRYLFVFQSVPGWTSMMVAIDFIGGLIFANLALLGLYIGKIFDETKQRPLYIIQETVGLHEENDENSDIRRQKGENHVKRHSPHTMGQKSSWDRHI